MRGKRGKERKNGGLGYIPPNWRHGADHARTIDSNQDLAATVAWNAIRDCTLKANRHYSQSIWKLRPESTSRRFVARLFNVFTYFYTKVSLDRHDCLNNGRWQSILLSQPRPSGRRVRYPPRRNGVTLKGWASSPEPSKLAFCATIHPSQVPVSKHVVLRQQRSCPPRRHGRRRHGRHNTHHDRGAQRH